jgi:hypothetical protein
MGFQWTNGYSAEVSAWLNVDGETFDIAQVGPHFLVLAEKRDIREGYAEITIDVDGSRSHYPVIIEGATIADEDPRIGFFISKAEKNRMC